MRDKAKKRDFQRRWIAQRRLDWIEANGGKCRLCGSTERLEVDHIDPSQKTEHRIWSWSKERREAELAKCQILCVRCHNEKTLQESGKPYRQHGTLSNYDDRGCRCELCCEAKREHQRSTRARKKARLSMAAG